MKIQNFHLVETLSILLMTIFGLLKGEVTVFYIIYLFWFQEFVRTCVDLFFIVKQRKSDGESGLPRNTMFGGFFLLFVYWVFIVVLFGFMLNFRDVEQFSTNVQVFVMKNWYFNLTLILFFVEYAMYRYFENKKDLEVPIFNRRHIILHISIILGALIQMVLLPKLDIENNWKNVAVVIPFLLLKIFLRTETSTKTSTV